MDNKQRIVAWLNSHSQVFDQLREAVIKTSQAAGRAGDASARTGESPATARALVDVQGAARHLLATAQNSRLLPPIPDAPTQSAFDAGLGLWIDAGTTLEIAAGRRDVPEVVRAAQTLEAGTDEILRAAAALRRATGQSPDPSNPHN